MKILFVGDMHAEHHDLDDCAKVVAFVERVAIETNPDMVCFLGDQHHNHAVLRLEVLQFWKAAFKLLRPYNTYALVGNHDLAGADGNAHAMLAYEGTDDVKIIDRPWVYKHSILFMPYIHENEEFVKFCSKFTRDDFTNAIIPTVVCHQSFDGSQYDNGFYVKDGINPNLIPQEAVISGHIHAGQVNGKIFYPGSPRWRNQTDAKQDVRAIWLIEFEDGKILNKTPYSTNEICRQIWHVVDTQEHPATPNGNPKDQWRIDVHGTPDYVRTRKAELSGPGVRVRGFAEQIASSGQVRESEGIAKAFRAYLGRFSGKYGTPSEVLDLMVKEYVGEL